jgi:hypothetical protein
MNKAITDFNKKSSRERTTWNTRWDKIINVS